jgi:hypothetical protein
MSACDSASVDEIISACLDHGSATNMDNLINNAKKDMVQQLVVALELCARFKTITQH